MADNKKIMVISCNGVLGNKNTIKKAVAAVTSGLAFTRTIIEGSDQLPSGFAIPI